MTKLTDLNEAQRLANGSEKTRVELIERQEEFFEGSDDLEGAYCKQPPETHECREFEFWGALIINISVFKYHAKFCFDFCDPDGHGKHVENDDGCDFYRVFEYPRDTVDEIMAQLENDCKMELKRTRCL